MRMVITSVRERRGQKPEHGGLLVMEHSDLLPPSPPLTTTTGLEMLRIGSVNPPSTYACSNRTKEAARSLTALLEL